MFISIAQIISKIFVFIILLFIHYSHNGDMILRANVRYFFAVNKHTERNKFPIKNWTFTNNYRTVLRKIVYGCFKNYRSYIFGTLYDSR